METGAQLSRFHLKMETGSSLRNVLFKLKDWTMYNIQNYDICNNNVPDSPCGLVVRVRFPALPDFQRSSGSGTGSTQPRDYN
jgi:hypothetical protein